MIELKISTADPTLIADIAALLAGRNGSSAVVASSSLPAPDPSQRISRPLDRGLVDELVSALTYQPLDQGQIAILRRWYDDADWVPVSGFNTALGERAVRGKLAGLAIRANQRVTRSPYSKLKVWTDIRYAASAAGGVSHKLRPEAREAVRRVLGL